MTTTSQIAPHNLIVLLSRGIGQRKLYFPGHPKVNECLVDCMRQLTLFFESSGLDQVFVGVDRGRFIYEGHYLSGSTIVGSKLISLIRNLASSGIGISAGLTRRELDELFTIAVELDDPLPDLTQARALLASRDIAGITLTAPYRPEDRLDADGEAWQGDLSDQECTIMIDQALFEAVGRVHEQVKLGHRLDIDEARAASESLIQAIKGGFCDLMQHVHYPDFDTYTVGHSVRMSLLGVLVAKTMEWDDDSLVEFSTAGLLHDVGKGKIPDEILFKAGRLDPEERRIIESHAPLGAETLLEVRGVGAMAIAAANGHHMHEDGGGYPRDGYRQERSLATAILQVCDVFEALTAVRPYKPPLTPRQAYEKMVGMHGAFNPIALRAFVRAVGLYPPGSHVRLSDGRLGLVMAAGMAFDRPQLMLKDTDTLPGEGNPDESVISLDSHKFDHLSVVELVDQTSPAPAPETPRDASLTS